MHYVCSDIHGQYDRFKALLRKINFSDHDTMYIIGDIIDRGMDPIPLLLDIMNRNNVIFLIGNHEHMMIQSELFGDFDAYDCWMDNMGTVTKMQFDSLSHEKKKECLDWLYERPLVIPQLEVGKRLFYLAHACHTLYPEKDILRYCDAGPQNIDQVVWSREYARPDRRRQGYMFQRLYNEYPGTTLIIGHSPVYGCSYGHVKKNGDCRISRTCHGHLINIDCGCARYLTLGCLRLEDMREFYVDRPVKSKKADITLSGLLRHLSVVDEAKNVV